MLRIENSLLMVSKYDLLKQRILLKVKSREEQKNLVSLPGIEPRTSSSYPAAIPTEISRLSKLRCK
jgi:hypothetical protein